MLTNQVKYITSHYPFKDKRSDLSFRLKTQIKMYTRILYSLCLMGIFTGSVNAQNIAPASIFGDNMVLQQGIHAPIWGTSAPNQKISLSFNDKLLSTKSDQQGNWLFKLPKQLTGGPFRMVIAATADSVVFTNVMVGEVWLASGQSNMQFTLHEAKNSAQELSEANYPNIRFFTVEHAISNKPLTKVQGAWKASNPDNAREFSAVAYFFARDLYQDKSVPVGIISASWGATPVEAWTSGEALLHHPDFKDSVIRYQHSDEDWELLYTHFLNENKEAKNLRLAGKAPVMPAQKNYPTALYNSMIAPLIPYGIKGVIWYQGENNATRAMQYRSLFPLLINDWRTLWKNSKLPFLFVQLANFRARNPEPVFTDNWASLREAQTLALHLPNTGMAVAIDIGDAKTIHPTDKQDVGKRLYMAAKHIAYHQPGVYSGPIYLSMAIRNNTLEISFQHTGSGLHFKGDKLYGFEIAGADRKFYWADGVIAGDKVILHTDQVPHPIAARYGWASNPPTSLYNSADLPASPFRTDNW